LSLGLLFAEYRLVIRFSSVHLSITFHMRLYTGNRRDANEHRAFFVLGPSVVESED
jgi:hypothetical protein